MNKSRRVVVTGMGVFSPLGLTMSETWSNLCQGKSGIDCISTFDTSDLPVKVAGEVKKFDPINYMDRRIVRRMSRTSQLALAAANAAIENAGLQIEDCSDTFGVCVGTGVGCLDKIITGLNSISQPSPTRVDPFGIISSLSNTPAAIISSQLKLNGPSSTIVTACASGIQAIGEAAEQIRRGWTDVMLCGGVDASILRVSFYGFCAMGLLDDRGGEPGQVCRPFAIDRNGLVLSEGSAFLILEESHFAEKRNANILAEVLGYSALTDSGSLFLPDLTGKRAAQTISQAISRSGLESDQIHYIHAHGTGTKANDLSETRAIKTVFGQFASAIPISSSKSMLGHMMGASGAIGVAVGLNVINEGVIPPTINLFNPDPECDLDYVPHKARKARVDNVLVNAFGLGGHNACMVLGKFN